MTTHKHPWNFFRAGNVVQVDIRSTEDLLHLAELDQKLWMALSMPTKGLCGDARGREEIDVDRDGQIRPPEVIGAINWLDSKLLDLQPVLDGAERLALTNFKDQVLVEAARHALKQKGRADALEVSLSDIDNAHELLALEVFNGDGVLVPEASQDPELAVLMQSIIVRYQAVSDRSGKLGINKEILANFFADLEGQLRWYADLDHQTRLGSMPLEVLNKAYEAYLAVEEKIDDYFTRCQWVAFDPRAENAANRLESDFHSIASGVLKPHDAVLASLPLSQIRAESILPLDRRINPAWKEAMSLFVKDTLHVLLQTSSLNQLTREQWRVVRDMIAPFARWRERQPLNPLRAWSLEELRSIPSPAAYESLQALIVEDEKVALAYEALKDLQKALLLTRDLATVLRNYVNFADFYRGQGALFQVGTLYIDGRATELCIEVNSAAKHGTMAALAGAYLAYCDCTRRGMPPRTIVAALTAGSSDNVMVGRNGVFYDREGRDWDATITKIVANPISLREAFWLPYKKLARFIEEQVAKRAAAADAASTTDLSGVAQVVTQIDRSKDKTATAAPTLLNRKIDVGTVAAMGVALGSIGTFFGLLFGKFLDLGLFMPIGILVLVALISGPSMLLAWLKLRNRNLGPILDANGWAINSMARINVPFAASLTRLRTLPLAAGSTLPDPFAERARPWKIWTVLALIVFFFLLWTSGRCDPYLPQALKNKSLLQALEKQQKSIDVPTP